MGIGMVIGAIFVWFVSGNKIEPGLMENGFGVTGAPEKTTRASLEKITEWYEAVGTVRPRTETRIEAQITAQVMDVKINPGNKVQKGQVLLILDNRQYVSRLDQARQGLKRAVAGKEQARHSIVAAQAAFTRADADYNRTKTYFESQAATSRDLETAESAFLQAKSGLSKAKEALSGAEAQIRHAEEVIKEAEIALGYTTIVAPESGEVLKRMVESGDMALPGKPLLFLQTSGFLRLEAYVREGLIKRVVPGSRLKVSMDTLKETADAEVEEIVPYADPQTRTFLVKVALPPIAGLYPGMYGKLLIPVKEQSVVMVPKEAVQRVGQLELVTVNENENWYTRFVKTGRNIDNRVEILSGLSGNETIGLQD